MKTSLGPIVKEKIIICSADANPDSQCKHPGPASHHFPNGKWVGALRNTAERLSCKFVILTTGHGLVEPTDIISPFDEHIDYYPDKIREKWEITIPHVLQGYKNSLLLFYSGGCPREPYIQISKPIFRTLNISVLTFGRPNMYDIDKVEDCVKMLLQGTTLKEIESILKKPDRLEFYYNLY